MRGGDAFGSGGGAWIGRVADWIGRHWLGIWLIGVGTYVAGAVAAPVLAWLGAERMSSVLYVLYRPMCHQLPHHSWFLFGPHAHYSWPELQPFTTAPLGRPLMSFHQPVRDSAVGYQVAVCVRDVATFSALFAASVGLAMARRGIGRLRPLPGAFYALALVPIGLDGLTQLVGWRESTPLLRTLTGALFGAATAAFVLPLLDAALNEVKPVEATGNPVGPLDDGAADTDAPARANNL